MSFCEFFKMQIEYCMGKLHGMLRIAAFFNLQQKAFPEGSRTDTCRFKILNYLENLFKFIFCSFNILKESKIVNNVYQFSSQVSIFIDITDYVFSRSEEHTSELQSRQYLVC